MTLRHRLTGWNAVKSRVEQLGLKLTDAEVGPHWLTIRYICHGPHELAFSLDQRCNGKNQGASRRPYTINGRRRFASANLPLWNSVRRACCRTEART